MTTPARQPIPQPTIAQLLHLVDRAADGRLLPGEAQLLRDGIRRLSMAARRDA